MKDYAEHKMSALVAKWGSPGEVNGFVFNALGARIRGRSKLPRGQRVICFSPHPDDDVISMGGILRKLVLNGNEITVAYMTSGNIAVFDHDVRRYLDWLGRLGAEGRVAFEEAAGLRRRVEDFLAAKRPGQVDSAEVLDLKRMIRESEAVSAIETLGLEAGAARFLNLPFYQTGKVRKDPIGPADVDIVRQLLEQVEPQLIFVAGDLSDPHGTHRMCMEAIDRALEEFKGSRPEVWLYRGAWQEWPVTGSDLAGSAVTGRAAAQDQGDLQAPVAEGLGALPRTRRARVLAAGRVPQQGDGGHPRPAGPGRVLRDGGVRCEAVGAGQCPARAAIAAALRHGTKPSAPSRPAWRRGLARPFPDPDRSAPAGWQESQDGTWWVASWDVRRVGDSPGAHWSPRLRRGSNLRSLPGLPTRRRWRAARCRRDR
jgi:LmbE family N-acetylglucosaminyl deacetylase